MIIRFTDLVDERDLQICLRVLAELADAPADDADRLRVRQAAHDFLQRGRKREKAAARRRQAEADAILLNATATGAVERIEGAPLEPPPPPTADTRELGALIRCYVCKAHFRVVDTFYHRMCPGCAQENRSHRTARADLGGRRALVTGGRVKAGFELVLKLLRDGASVTAVTRFPHDARRRFAEVHDAGDWRHRLRVVGLDLRDPAAVSDWCDALVEAGEPLDILVNLAAQTVRRPDGAYSHLIAAERAAERTLITQEQPNRPLASPHQPDSVLNIPEQPGPAAHAHPPLPVGMDIAGLLHDPAPVNSWTRLVHEIDPVELVEVQLINVTAPFLLLSRLRPLLESSPFQRRYVVNVTAVEGQFSASYKGSEHPHTNMAKAALNMLTLTAAAELAGHGIHLTSVDPGWFTDQHADPERDRRRAGGFRPPLDVVDAAARVYDPIVRGERGETLHGCLLKDYRVVPW